MARKRNRQLTIGSRIRRAIGRTLALAILAAFIWVFAAERILDALITSYLRAQRPGSVDLIVTYVSLNRITIDQISMGSSEDQPPDLSIERVNAEFGWPAILVGQFELIKVTGLELTGSSAGAGVSWGAIDALLPAGGAPWDPADIFESPIEIDQFAIQLITAAGTGIITSDDVIAPARDRAFKANAQLVWSAADGARSEGQALLQADDQGSINFQANLAPVAGSGGGLTLNANARGDAWSLHEAATDLHMGRARVFGAYFNGLSLNTTIGEDDFTLRGGMAGNGAITMNAENVNCDTTCLDMISDIVSRDLWPQFDFANVDLSNGAFSADAAWRVADNVWSIDTSGAAVLKFGEASQLSISLEDGSVGRPFLLFDQGVAGIDAKLMLRNSAKNGELASLAIVASSETSSNRLEIERARIAFAPLSFANGLVASAERITLNGSIGFDGAGRLKIDGRVDLNGPLTEIFGFKDGSVSLQGVLDAEGGLVLVSSDQCARFEGARVSMAGFEMGLNALQLCETNVGEPIFGFLLGVNEGAELPLSIRARIPSAEIFAALTGDVGRAQGALPTVQLAVQTDLRAEHWRADLAAQGGQIVALPLNGSVNDLDIDVAARGRGGNIDFAEATLRQVIVNDSKTAKRFAPLKWTGDLQIRNDQLTADAQSFDPAGRPLVSVKAHHGLTTGEGQLVVETGDLLFEDSGLQIKDLAPFVEAYAARTQGELGASLNFSWDPTGFASDGRIRIKELGVENTYGQFEGVTGEIELTSVAPLETADRQVLTISRIDAGLALNDGRIEFDLAPEGVLALHQADWPWLGGRIIVRNGRLAIDSTEQRVDLAIENAELGEILKLIDIESLSGQGRIGGDLPIAISDGAISIESGAISSVEPGVIRYRSSAAANSDSDKSAILFKALDNFEFDDLSAEINGGLSDDLSVAIHLKGRNPDLYDGHPVEINVNTNGPFLSMIRNGLIGYTVRERIERGENPIEENALD